MNWAEEAGLPVFPQAGQQTQERRKKIHHASRRDKATSHVGSRVEWPLTTSPTGPGVAGRILET